MITLAHCGQFSAASKASGRTRPGVLTKTAAWESTAFLDVAFTPSKLRTSASGRPAAADWHEHVRGIVTGSNASLLSHHACDLSDVVRNVYVPMESRPHGTRGACAQPIRLSGTTAFWQGDRAHYKLPRTRKPWIQSCGPLPVRPIVGLVDELLALGDVIARGHREGDGEQREHRARRAAAHGVHHRELSEWDRRGEV